MKIFVYEYLCACSPTESLAKSLHREGWAMLSAAVEDFKKLPEVKVYTLLDDQSPLPLGDVCTRVSGKDEVRQFQNLAQQCDWTLVIAPEFDDLLRNKSQAVMDAGGRLLGSSPEAIYLTADKLRTALLWHERGVPHPLTQFPGPLEFATFPPPWVLKPRYGAGSQALHLIRSENEIDHCWNAARQAWLADFIVQQYVSGQAASVALLIGFGQAMPLMPARQHLSGDGTFRYEGGSMPLSDSHAERAIHLACHAAEGIPGLQGYVGIDLVLGDRDDGGNDFAIELNPRLTTSYLGLRQLCRQNLAELMLKCVNGESMASPGWLPGEIRF